MPLNTIPQNALIVVGTGEKALFFRNTGSRFDIALKAEGHLEPKDLDNDGRDELILDQGDEHNVISIVSFRD